MNTTDDLKRAMAADIGTFLHAPADTDAAEAFRRMVDPVDSLHLYAGAVAFFAGLASAALQTQRAAMPPGPARNAPFALLPGSTDGPVDTAGAQIITASANNDTPMVHALIRPWAFSDDARARAHLLTYIAQQAREMHRAICDCHQEATE